MFELTNEQRKCFGLLPVAEGWTLTKLKESPHDEGESYVYIDGDLIRKCVYIGHDRFVEYELCEQLSEDGKYLLPKTSKGKPTLLTAATVQKRKGFGMCLGYGKGYITLYNQTSQRDYYNSSYESLSIKDLKDFAQWVSDWCANTTKEDIEDISRFAIQPRKHIKIQEGDVFRYKINRRLYGYGRILLDYDRMRKNKEDFWDILMGKPLVYSVYHIATERSDVTIEELSVCKSLPSQHMMDNCLYYGEYEIIGNIPIREHEDYPIMYGESLDFHSRAVHLQCGKMHHKKTIGTALVKGFGNNAIGFRCTFPIAVLMECIAQNSNAPYWAQDNWQVNRDLRNPKFCAELEQVCKQFHIPVTQLVR